MVPSDGAMLKRSFLDGAPASYEGGGLARHTSSCCDVAKHSGVSAAKHAAAPTSINHHISCEDAINY